MQVTKAGQALKLKCVGRKNCIPSSPPPPSPPPRPPPPPPSPPSPPPPPPSFFSDSECRRAGCTCFDACPFETICIINSCTIGTYGACIPTKVCSVPPTTRNPDRTVPDYTSDIPPPPSPFRSPPPPPPPPTYSTDSECRKAGCTCFDSCPFNKICTISSCTIGAGGACIATKACTGASSITAASSLSIMSAAGTTGSPSPPSLPVFGITSLGRRLTSSYNQGGHFEAMQAASWNCYIFDLLFVVDRQMYVVNVYVYVKSWRCHGMACGCDKKLSNQTTPTIRLSHSPNLVRRLVSQETDIEENILVSKVISNVRLKPSFTPTTFLPKSQIQLDIAEMRSRITVAILLGTIFLGQIRHSSGIDKCCLDAERIAPTGMSWVKTLAVGGNRLEPPNMYEFKQTECIPWSPPPPPSPPPRPPPPPPSPPSPPPPPPSFFSDSECRRAGCTCFDACRLRQFAPSTRAQLAPMEHVFRPMSVQCLKQHENRTVLYQTTLVTFIAASPTPNKNTFAPSTPQVIAASPTPNTNTFAPFTPKGIAASAFPDTDTFATTSTSQQPTSAIGLCGPRHRHPRRRLTPQTRSAGEPVALALIRDPSTRYAQLVRAPLESAVHALLPRLAPAGARSPPPRRSASCLQLAPPAAHRRRPPKSPRLRAFPFWVSLH
eukprot:jgi/Botrbrau1/4658/Bobra.33_2s0029.1